MRSILSAVLLTSFFTLISVTLSAQDANIRTLWDETGSIDFIKKSLEDSLRSKGELLQAILKADNLSPSLKSKLKSSVQKNNLLPGHLVSLLSFSPGSIKQVGGIQPKFKINSLFSEHSLIGNQYFGQLLQVEGAMQIGGIPFQINQSLLYNSMGGFAGMPLKLKFDKKTHLKSVQEKLEQQFNIKEALTQQVNFRAMAEEMVKKELQGFEGKAGLQQILSASGLTESELLLLDKANFEKRLATFSNTEDVAELKNYYQQIHSKEKELNTVLSYQNITQQHIDEVTKEDKFIRSASKVIKMNGWQRFFTKLDRFDLGKMGFTGGTNNFIDGFGSGLLLQEAEKLGLGAGAIMPQFRSLFRDKDMMPAFQDVSAVNLNLFKVKEAKASNTGNMIGIGYSMERPMNGLYQVAGTLPANVLNLQFRKTVQLFPRHEVDIHFAKSMRQYLADEKTEWLKNSTQTITDFIRDSRVGLGYKGDLQKIGLQTNAMLQYSGVGYTNTNVAVNRNGRLNYALNLRQQIPNFKASYVEVGWRGFTQDMISLQIRSNRVNSKLHWRINKLVRVMSFVDAGSIRYTGETAIPAIKTVFAQSTVFTKGHLGFLPLDHAVSVVVSQNSVSDLLLPTGIQNTLSAQHTGSFVLSSGQLSVKNGLSRNVIGGKGFLDYLGEVSYATQLLKQIGTTGGVHYQGNGSLARQLGMSVNLNGQLMRKLSLQISYTRQLDLITNQNPWAFPNQRGGIGISYLW